MRIGIIGQPCIDEVIQAGSSESKRALGGVLYSYAAMERIICESRHNATFVPLTWLCSSDTPVLEPLLRKFTHLDRTQGLWQTDALTNRVQLVYAADGSRVEHCPNVLPALTANELMPELLSTLDGLFVNMISGFDVAIDTLESALDAAEKRPFVHIDIHALILGSLSEHSTHANGDTANGNTEGVESTTTFGSGRQPHGVKDWKRWLAVANSVQLNELEVSWLGHPEVTTEKELIEFIEREQDHMYLEHLILTRGANGATLYELSTNEVHHVLPPSVQVVDTTGAGDAFGSILLYSMLTGYAPAEALERAVEWATWCTTLSTIDDILTEPLVTELR